LIVERVMPRFHISLHRAGQRPSDAAAIDCADFAAVRDEATRSARELVMNAVETGTDDVPDRVVVIDDSGREVLVVRLIDVVPHSLRNRTSTR
jgi:hypothetical protein